MTKLIFKKENGCFQLYTNNGNIAGTRLERGGDKCPPLVFQFKTRIEAVQAVDLWRRLSQVMG